MKKVVSFQYIIWICVMLTKLNYCAVIRERKQNKDCNNSEEEQTRSFLWTIKRDPPAYLFGTIHVPYTRVWNFIPDNAKVAFRQSENVFFELDLTNPYTMSQLANCQLLPHGKNLSNILPKDIYTRLKDHLEYIRERMSKWITADQKGKGLYGDYLFDIIAGNWERKRPIWVMLLVNSLTESDIKSREVPVLDLYLAQEAERLQKNTGAVEKVEEQCVPLNDLNYSQVLFALNRTLGQHESYRLQNRAIPFTTDDLIHHYNCGDLNGIIFNKDSSQVANLFNASLPQSDLKTAKLIDHYFRTELINKRNERMAERIAGLLQENPAKSFFFAFGAGHFLGNNTVVDRLRRMGLEIEHTSPDTEIPRVKIPKHRKNKRRNKVQEDFGDVWDEMDPESRSWLEKSRAERRRKYNSNKPFNDLWVRMETPRPEMIQKLASDTKFYNSNSRLKTTPRYQHYLFNTAPSSSFPRFKNFTVVLTLIWAIFVNLATT
ncbi:metalloprotease TIKI1-like [Mya arenaria]|uniref:metalloprotease TIKI1-like n=1 Tax=Mya arenaria TaxID=6604 RepID=UPI0022E90280|nr:metalloprotease TIKI1-like [Mya arenaria]